MHPRRSLLNTISSGRSIVDHVALLFHYACRSMILSIFNPFLSVTIAFFVLIFFEGHMHIFFRVPFIRKVLFMDNVNQDVLFRVVGFSIVLGLFFLTVGINVR